MAEVKTRPTDVSVASFIEALDHPGKRADAAVLDELFRKVTGEEPRMWGPTIIGYGSYHYKYDSGHEGDCCRIGFSPRKAKHSLYLMGGYCDPQTGETFDDLLAKLGKHSRGKGCLYINKLADVDLEVLERMIQSGWQAMNELYPPD